MAFRNRDYLGVIPKDGEILVFSDQDDLPMLDASPEYVDRVAAKLGELGAMPVFDVSNGLPGDLSELENYGFLSGPLTDADVERLLTEE